MKKFWNGLPTEYQLTIIIGVLMLGCFFSTPLHPTYDKNIGTIVTGLGSLAGVALVHGGMARSKWAAPDADKDIKGDAQ
jgi:hypothetical protein